MPVDTVKKAPRTRSAKQPPKPRGKKAADLTSPADAGHLHEVAKKNVAEIASASSEVSDEEVVNKRRRQRRSIDTRGRIIDAALSEFAERGFDGASTRAVADLAGIRHTLVNYHFGSKEALYRSVMTTVLQDYLSIFEDRLHGLRGVDDVIQLRLLQEEFIRFVANNPRFNLIMANEARQSSDRLSWLATDMVKPIFLAITPLIQSAQRTGHYVQGEPYHLQYLFIGATTRIFMLSAEVQNVAGWLPAGEDFLERHIEACLSLFFRTPPDAPQAMPDNSEK